MTTAPLYTRLSPISFVKILLLFVILISSLKVYIYLLLNVVLSKHKQSNYSEILLTQIRNKLSVNIFRHFYDVLISTIGWGDIGQQTLLGA